MRTVGELLAHLRRLDVQLWAEGDRLHLSTSKGALPPDLRTELGERKAEILAFLREADIASSAMPLPIQPVPRTENLPLSFAQQRLWFLDQLEGQSATYNIPMALHLSGTLDMAALERSLTEIVQRHEALRTSFTTVNGSPVQVIAPTQSFSLSVGDLQGLPEEEQSAEVQRLATEEARRPFDLEQGPLLRVTLLRLGAAEHVLLVTVHHIVFDGWSMGIFVQELSLLYNAFLSGQPSPLSNLPIQYADFAYWQRQWLQGNVLETQLAYWKQQLANAPSVLRLPTDRPRPAVQTFRGCSERFELSYELMQRLEALTQRSGATLFMTLLAAFAALLSRYSGQDDIVIGSPIANRNHKEIEPLIGFFANTLVLCIDLSGNPTFLELISRVREVSLGAYDHQDVPFERLVEALQPERNLSHSPLFQVMFVLQNTPLSALELQGLTLSPVEVERGTAKFDLTLLLKETEYGLIGKLEYNTDLFDAATMTRMVGHFQALLEAVVANPEQPLLMLPLLTEAERQQLLVEWNDTKTDYQQDRCIHQLFEVQVKRTPNAVAAVFEDEELTYQELNRRANQLAHYLRTLGVGPEVPVGICLERSLEMVVGVLGVLKAGGAYVPLDPMCPQERLTFMLEDAHVWVLLTQQRLTKQLPQHGARTVCLDTDWGTISRESEDDSTSNTTPEAMAYVIYTSGSTGKPKGVVVQHRSVLNLLRGLYQAIYIHQPKAQLRVSLNGPLAFDTSVKQLIQLLNGHMLYIVPSKIRFDGDALLAYLQCHQLDVFDCTPSQLGILLAAGLLRKPGHIPGHILVAGEAIDESTWQMLAQVTQTTFYNLYGPTECTVDATVGQVQLTSSKPTIGRPLANTQIYILDQHLQPVPVGMPGELYIGGVGLARGYLNRPELTAERFIPNPFCDGGEPELGARLYKTGDLARFLTDGNIEFLGRVDHQVKIHGFRVELGEIEAALAGHPNVQEAVAAVWDARRVPGDKRLVAYFVPAQESVPAPHELRRFLKGKLPDYMVPAAFVSLDAIPLTPNGKVDRRALPVPNRAGSELEEAFVAPRTRAEKVLAGIWANVLGIERVGIHDNFFELGGDSILSIQIIARANQAGLQLTPRQLFQHQTVAELAAVSGAVPTIRAEQGLVTGPVPLTPIQHRFFEQDFPNPHHWNMAMLLEARQALDPVMLEKAVRHLSRHHDALRLCFVRTELGWQQFNAGLDAQIAFTQIDLSVVPKAEQKRVIEVAAAEIQASLDLSKGPLAQVALLSRGRGEPSLLLMVIHHLVVDGVSWRILLEDLQTAYHQLSRGEAIRLSPKTTSFRDWAKRLTEYAQAAALHQELVYWLAEDRAQVPRLPVDYPGSASANTEASARTVSVSLSAEETRALLHKVPAVYGTRINDVLLTALVKAFAQWTGARMLLLDLEGHGREQITDDVDLSRTVGWFTTVFPVFLDAGDTSHLGEALKSVKEQLRRIPNRGIGYGLLRYLSGDAALAKRLSEFPRAEVSFNYLGQFDQSFTGHSLLKPASEPIGPVRSLQGRRRHLLAVNGSITGGQLQLDWTYSENIHRQATVETVAHSFMEVLQSLIAHCRSISGGAVRYMPSDFPLAKMNQKTLDQLTNEGQQVEDIYPLSPGQQEILWSILHVPKEGVYCLQWIFSLRGDLNVSAFKLAWQRIVDRHSVLRTAFMAGGLDEPLQIVYKQVRLPWEQKDWRGQSPGKQQEQLEAFLQADRKQGFELFKAPLMRMALIRMTETTYQFIWSHHHLLLDGWSVAPLWKEVSAFYRAFSQNGDLHLEHASPYRDYIAWLQEQDLAMAEAFWRKALRGVTAPISLGVDRVSRGVSSLEAGYAEQQVQLTRPETARLQSLARRHRLTLNILVQGAWALLLSRYSGKMDAVFGVTVSGRPVDLRGVESMVGLFVNTLPVRVKVPPERSLLPWLERLQNLQVELRQYEYVSLSRVREWCGVPSEVPLFESFLRFQNYPLGASLWKSDFGNLEIQYVRGVDWWHYPLGLVAVPRPELLLRIAYDQRRFEAVTITQMLRHLQGLLEGFEVGATSQSVDALMG